MLMYFYRLKYQIYIKYNWVDKYKRLRKPWEIWQKSRWRLHHCWILSEFLSNCLAFQFYLLLHQKFLLKLLESLVWFEKLWRIFPWLDILSWEHSNRQTAHREEKSLSLCMPISEWCQDYLKNLSNWFLQLYDLPNQRPGHQRMHRMLPIVHQ